MTITIITPVVWTDLDQGLAADQHLGGGVLLGAAAAAGAGEGGQNGASALARGHVLETILSLLTRIL